MTLDIRALTAGHAEVDRAWRDLDAAYGDLLLALDDEAHDAAWAAVDAATAEYHRVVQRLALLSRQALAPAKEAA